MESNWPPPDGGGCSTLGAGSGAGLGEAGLGTEVVLTGRLAAGRRDDGTLTERSVSVAGRVASPTGVRPGDPVSTACSPPPADAYPVASPATASDSTTRMAGSVIWRPSITAAPQCATRADRAQDEFFVSRIEVTDYGIQHSARSTHNHPDTTVKSAWDRGFALGLISRG